jgi:hypothetical protein
MTHLYRLGDHVRLNPGFTRRNAAPGPYQVLQQLPCTTDGEHQYRIKSTGEQYERVVKESDLEQA